MFKKNKKIGVVAGSFDLLHAGHAMLLEDCKNACEYLIVLLHIDPTLDRPEKNKPVQTVLERKIQLSATKYVDEIYLYNTEKELYDWLCFLKKKYKKLIRILGTDYKDNTYTGDDLNIPIYWHDRYYLFSSSELRNRIYVAESFRTSGVKK